MTLKIHHRLLLSIFGACFALVWGLAFVLEPLDGDLTRVGGFTENDFHWRVPQPTFRENLFKVAKDLSEYDRYYDVVLLGDSFSCDQVGHLFGWQNFLINRTGLSVITIDTRRYWPIEILESETFKKHPPRYFIFESVERYLNERAAYFAKDPRPFRENPLPPANFHPVNAPSPMALRPQTRCWDTDYALGYLNAVMQRRFHLNNQVTVLPLANNDGLSTFDDLQKLSASPGSVGLEKAKLFSSRVQDRMLIYFDEAKKHDLAPADLETLRAGMLEFQNLAESNGKTHFVFVIAPDKSSIYAPYLANPSDATHNLVENAAKDPRIHLVRTDLTLTQSITSGIPDVYLPNDSHWGGVGHQRVADALVDFWEGKPAPK